MAIWEDFTKLDVRVGTIIDIQEFPEAQVPAYKLRIDFGPSIGIKRSSARIVKNYSKETLMERQVVCIVNFPKKQIGNFFSDVLVMGIYNESADDVILLKPERYVKNGTKIG
ncbi:tRNA-binding protein [Candidatus Micrarchaeota archaeon]|nr:tRNA-binding protein [Candidatus Micrarchaeota archaeon]